MVDVHQMLVHQLCVDLCGRNIRVSHHLLNGPQVCPVLQQVSRKGVPQCMGGNLGFDPRLFLIVLDELPKALSAHALTVHIYKQRRLTFGNQTGPDVFM